MISSPTGYVIFVMTRRHIVWNWYFYVNYNNALLPNIRVLNQNFLKYMMLQWLSFFQWIQGKILSYKHSISFRPATLSVHYIHYCFHHFPSHLKNNLHPRNIQHKFWSMEIPNNVKSSIKITALCLFFCKIFFYLPIQHIVFQ